MVRKMSILLRVKKRICLTDDRIRRPLFLQIDKNEDGGSSIQQSNQTRDEIYLLLS